MADKEISQVELVFSSSGEEKVKRELKKIQALKDRIESESLTKKGLPRKKLTEGIVALKDELTQRQKILRNIQQTRKASARNVINKDTSLLANAPKRQLGMSSARRNRIIDSVESSGMGRGGRHYKLEDKIAQMQRVKEQSETKARILDNISKNRASKLTANQKVTAENSMQKESIADRVLKNIRASAETRNNKVIPSPKITKESSVFAETIQEKVMANIQKSAKARKDRVKPMKLSQESSVFNESTKERVLRNLAETKLARESRIQSSKVSQGSSVFNESTKERVMRNIAENRRAREARVTPTKITEGNSAFQESMRERILRNIAETKSKRKVSERYTAFTPDTSPKSKLAMMKEKMEERRYAKTYKDYEKRNAKLNSGQSGGISSLMRKSMMVMGFAMMAGRLISSVASGAMAYGDATAEVEVDAIKGQAYRADFAKTRDVKDFDKAVDKHRYLTGMAKYKAASDIASVSGEMESSGIKLSGGDLTKLVESIHGLSLGKGIDSQAAAKKIQGIMAGNVSAREAGMTGVKKGKNPAETLDSIYKWLKTNPVTSALMNQRTLSATMTSIKSTPMEVLSDIQQKHPEQSKEGFDSIDKILKRFFDVDDWASVMAQFETGMKDLEKVDWEAVGTGVSVVASGIVKLGLGLTEFIGTMATIPKMWWEKSGVGNAVDWLNDKSSQRWDKDSAKSIDKLVFQKDAKETKIFKSQFPDNIRPTSKSQGHQYDKVKALSDERFGDTDDDLRLYESHLTKMKNAGNAEKVHQDVTEKRKELGLGELTKPDGTKYIFNNANVTISDKNEVIVNGLSQGGSL